MLPHAPDLPAFGGPVVDQELAAVCQIFQRINQSGKRLDRFDLIAAMTFREDFDLRERFRLDLIRRLEDRRFGPISPAVATQLMALVEVGFCTERHEYDLTAESIKKLWPTAVAAVLLAADTLRKTMGVINAGDLPYDALLTLLAYYFAKSGKRSLPPEHLDWVRRWFWRASFAQHCGTSGPTRMGQDRELFDELIAGKIPAFAPHREIGVDELIATRMTWSRSAVRNAYLCLLATRNPLHLLNNGPLDLVNEISDFTSAERHHIFPKKFLSGHGPAGAEVHAVANFCFLPAELNREILDKTPAAYVAELRETNPNFENAVQTHLIPTGPDSGIWKNDYLTFLAARGRLIVDEMNRLCGDLVTPRPEERQAALERLEHRVRDCIDRILMERVGRRYWRKAVPEAVRAAADQRIEAALRKFPDRRPRDFEIPRERLNYMNVMDYVTVIENGGNWPYFEPIFPRKDDVKRYFEHFSEYRNAVMHGRGMTELVRLTGEASIVWLENVLPGTSDEEDAAEAGATGRGD